MAEETSVETKKSSNKMLLIIIIVLIVFVLIGGILAAVLLLSGNDDANVAANDTQTAQVAQKRKTTGRSNNLLTIGPMYPMDQFVVNLLSESGSRFLKISLNIELENQDMSVELDNKKPIVRDIIIRSLSSKTFEEISTTKGKERLKDEIVDMINEILTDGQVKNIFFTDFVIQ